MHGYTNTRADWKERERERENRREEEGCKGDGSGGEVGRHGTRAT